MLALTHVDYRSGDAMTPPRSRRRRTRPVRGRVGPGPLGRCPRVDLHAWDADFAVGCCYKYLNGGPGAPGCRTRRGVGTRTREARSRAGSATTEPFAFDPDYTPAPDARRFHAGTPHVLSTVALEPALEAFAGVSPADLDAKARSLTYTFVALVEARCGDAVEIASPTDARRRGAQVSLRHPRAYALTQALIDRGVIGDHRPPDLLRLGFAPLYVRHVDVHDAVEVLADVLGRGTWDRPEYHRRRTVT